MSAVLVESLSGSAPASPADYLGDAISSAFVDSRDDGTNDLPRFVDSGTQADRTIDFAMTHYEDLLRRLAD